MTTTLPAEGCTREDVLVHLDYLEDVLGLCLPPSARDLVRKVYPAPTRTYRYGYLEIGAGYCWTLKKLARYSGHPVPAEGDSRLPEDVWYRLRGCREQESKEPWQWKTYRTLGEAWAALADSLSGRGLK